MYDKLDYELLVKLKKGVIFIYSDWKIIYVLLIVNLLNIIKYIFLMYKSLDEGKIHSNSRLQYLFGLIKHLQPYM